MKESGMRDTDAKPLRGIASALLLVGGMAFLNGCESIERAIKGNPKTAAGAGVGGAGGALIGGLASGGTGALVGGLTGVLAGGVIGHLLERQERTGAATSETIAYTDEKGDVVRIEEVSLNPQSIRPGETINVNMQYAIVSKGDAEPTRVREIRHIYYKGELVGNPVVEVQRWDGTYWSTLPIKLPESAAPGSYEVVAGVEMNGALDRWESRFMVVQR
jgi:predicted lipid-binding transport protein (Tim44 family)